jgi:predicted transcriptional regulator of viral defense system
LASNVLYAPSYVSLEYVLSLYGLIPEKVAQVTAVTTRKTARFSNPIGSFSFRHVKRDLFFGYTDQKDENGAAVLVATPEKALLDKIYLDAPARLTREYLAEGLRLQNEEVLQIRRMRTYARRFRSDKIDEAVRLLSKR